MSKAQKAAADLIAQKEAEINYYINEHPEVFKPYFLLQIELKELRDQSHLILMNRAKSLYPKR